MDLRPLLRYAEQRERAKRLFNYQPFVLSDDCVTGIGYSWAYLADPDEPRAHEPAPYVFERESCTPEEWRRITATNQCVRNFYDAVIAKLADRFAGGSILDIGCSSGYFLARAMQHGMRDALGVDFDDYTEAVSLLNELCGVEARFHRAKWEGGCWTPPFEGTFDVVNVSEILLHVSDPLVFLAMAASHAKQGLFLWSKVDDSEDWNIRYAKDDVNRFIAGDFPYCFDGTTVLSKGLLLKSMELLGFSRVEEIEKTGCWLPERFFPHDNRALLFLR